jgi:glycine dehydrogenase subunit 1
MLTGMDVSNASLYDGATAAAEAALMSLRTTKRSRVLVSRSVHPEYREVMKTYLQSNDCELVDVPYTECGATDVDELDKILDDSFASLVVQSPNFFGVIEDLAVCEQAVHGVGALLIASFSEPLAFGILKPPGAFGADIVCGEGQSLGMPVGFGGPYLGILTCKKQLLRTMPGRVAGRTVDIRGRTAYVLTLTAREQHIRREKATSNICTNQGLCALTAAAYLASLGKRGFRKLAVTNHERAEYAKREITKVKGVSLRFSGRTFNEFVIKTSRDPALLEEKLLDKKILPGIILGRYDDTLGDCILVTVTEMNSREEIDTLCRALKEIA